MSHELRQDPCTGRWVIVAPARGRRPGAHGPAGQATSGEGGAASPAFVPTCPFCPGNENSTPPEVYRLAAPDGGWRARVVPNLFPAVAPLGEAGEAVDPSASLFARQPAVGAHEVVIDTPFHSRHLADMDQAELAALLGVYQARYRALAAQPGVKYVSLFRNHGRDAGTSQPHPHAQLIAVPIVPTDVKQRWDKAARYQAETGRCLYCDLLAAERSGERLVLDTGAFVAACAYAPRFPFETWILPAQCREDFGAAGEAELAELAEALRRVLAALRQAMGDPPFNLVFHSAPAPATDGTMGPPAHAGRFHWHLQIVPRTTRQAGFEIGTEMAIVAVPPELAAAELRACL